jgi:hypothetical protein
MRRRPLLPILAALTALACGPVPPGEPVGTPLDIQRDPATDMPGTGWAFVSVPGKRDTVFRAGSDGLIAIQADRSVGFLLREAPDPASGPWLTWRWRVDAAPPPASPDAKGRDDRPAALHVIFAAVHDAARPARGLGQWLLEAALPKAFAGRTITYMWGGTLPSGSRLANPYRPHDGRIVVLRGPEAPLGTWLTEATDPVADYQALFGAPAPPLTHLALSADTEDNGGCARSFIDPPRFVPARQGGQQ